MSTNDSMKVRAPGKLILSGEHAIVYGQPALAMAVNRYAEVQVHAQKFPLISFDLGDLAYREALRFASLDRLKDRIKQKYRRFLRGEFKIRQVLKKPVELAQFALGLFYEMLNVRPTQGVKIKLQSDIPIGCGMGSSAAIILSVLHALAHHLELSVDEELFFRLALEAENLQHGYSSGLDLRVSQHGGCILMQDKQVYTRELPSFPLYIINTGSPLSTTGECVAEVVHHFRDQGLAKAFSEVTTQMDQALARQDKIAFQAALTQNHDLLTQLSVVPEKVQRFVSEVQGLGGAAKTCGAGAVRGEQAGIVLASLDSLAALAELCQRYCYDLLAVGAEARGVHVVA